MRLHNITFGPLYNMYGDIDCPEHEFSYCPYFIVGDNTSALNHIATFNPPGRPLKVALLTH